MIRKVDIGQVVTKSALYVYLTASVIALFWIGESKGIYGLQIWVMYFYIILVSRILVGLADLQAEQHANSPHG